MEKRDLLERAREAEVILKQIPASRWSFRYIFHNFHSEFADAVTLGDRWIHVTKNEQSASKNRLVSALDFDVG